MPSSDRETAARALAPKCDGICEYCDGGEVVQTCCPEGEPCQYRGARLTCEECGGDGKCRCDDCAALLAATAAAGGRGR